MAECPSPVEKRSIPRIKRTKLEQFPCCYSNVGGCEGDECVEDMGMDCAFPDIYRQAIADQRCARLLRVFEKRWGRLICQALLGRSIQTTIKYAPRWSWKRIREIRAKEANSFRLLRGSIRSALREAGL